MLERRVVGRGAELARLDVLLAEARAGRPRLAVLSGPPGIGKSTLLHHLGRRISGRETGTREGPDEVRTVALTADRAESGLAFAMLGGVLAQLRPNLPFSSVPPAADPFTVGLGLLTDLGAHPPTVLLLDDAQWADVPSLRSLLFALRRLRREQLLVVLTQRSGESAPEELARIAELPLAETIALAGLDPVAAAALCAAVVGAGLTSATVGRLHGETGGNPLWLAAAARHLDGAGHRDPGEPLPPPPAYGEIVARQLAVCPPAVRALADAVAVTGSASLREVAPVYAAAGGSLADWPDAVVEAASAARLVGAVDGATLRPFHALTGSAVYWAMPAGRRAALHRAAADAAPDPERRLDHRIAADAVLADDTALVADLVAHADRLRTQGAAARAAALTLAAADRSDAAAARTLRTQAGIDLVRAGDLEGAGRVVDDGDDDAPALALRGALALLGGRPTEAAALLRRGYEGAGPDRATAGMCAAQYTALIINLGRGEETLRWARRSASLTPADGMAQLMLHAAEGVLADGPGPWPQVEAPSAALAGTLAGTGVQWLWRGRDDTARRLLAEGLSVALREGPMIVGIIAGYYLVEASYRLGDPAAALRVSDANVSLAHDTEMTWTWTLVHATRVAPLVALGRLAEAREHLDLARRASTGDYAAVLWLAQAGARLALAGGDPAGALAALAEMEPYADAAGAGNPSLQPWRLLQVFALTALGRSTDADALLAPVEASLAVWPRRWAQAQAVRCRAALERDRGDLDGASAVLAAGVATADGDPSWEAALLRADHGALLRRRGRRTAARAQLQIAYDRLTAMGATPAASVVDAELAALDGRAGDGMLTGREREIADRVARGASNREIAAALHVSVKTVEYHLGHTYAKLGVRSRGGVGAALRVRGPVGVDL